MLQKLNKSKTGKLFVIAFLALFLVSAAAATISINGTRLDMQGNLVNNFFDSNACGSGSAVVEVFSNGSYNCSEVKQNLSSVLSEGNDAGSNTITGLNGLVMNGQIDMAGNDVVGASEYQSKGGDLRFGENVPGLAMENGFGGICIDNESQCTPDFGEIKITGDLASGICVTDSADCDGANGTIKAEKFETISPGTHVGIVETQVIQENPVGQSGTVEFFDDIDLSGQRIDAVNAIDATSIDADDISTSGSVDVGGTLTVDSTSDFNNDIDVSGDNIDQVGSIDVDDVDDYTSGEVTFSSPIDVANINNGDTITIDPGSGSLSVTQGASFDGTVNLNSNSLTNVQIIELDSLAGPGTVNPITLFNDLDVNGEELIDTSDGSVTLGDDLDLGGNKLEDNTDGIITYSETLTPDSTSNDWIESRLLDNPDSSNDYVNIPAGSNNQLASSGSWNFIVDSGTYNCFLSSSDGDFSCDGSKNWIHPVNSTHKAKYSAQESGEVRAVWDSSVMVNNPTGNGNYKKKVMFPNHYVATIVKNPDLIVQVTPESLATVAATRKTSEFVVIKSDKPVDVDLTVKGIREGYKDKDIVERSTRKSPAEFRVPDKASGTAKQAVNGGLEVFKPNPVNKSGGKSQGSVSDPRNSAN